MHIMKNKSKLLLDKCVNIFLLLIIICYAFQLTLGVDHNFDSSKSQMKRMNRQIPLDVAYDDDPGKY